MAFPTAPDAAVVTIAHLNSKGLTAPAYGVVPDPRPAQFVRVMATGGAGRSHRVIHRGLVVVECWGGSIVEASDLAREVEPVVLAMEDEGVAYRVVPGSAFGLLPDPTSKQARYTATFELVLRAV